MPSESDRPGSLQRLHRYSAGGELSPWLQSRKVKLFAVSFSIILVLGLVWTVFQPLVYRSSATVLMSAPSAIDAGVSEANIQNVAIQRTILLGQEITLGVVDELADAHQFSMSDDALNDALHVIPVPDTNLIEMIALGSDGDVLPTLVNTWIEVYMAVRAEDIALRKDRTVRVVQEELAELAIKIEQTRDNLALYRRQNDIISAKREENEVLARLNGLNKALNTAVEEEVKTRVYLEALQESIQKGQPIIPSSDLRSLRSLESELEQLRVEMLVISKRYTKEYIEKHPSMRAIPERITELEKDLAIRVSEGQALELATARQAYSAARRALQALQEKLDEHKQKVSKFSRIYATHEALVEDLRGLEELNRETQARLVQVEVRQVDKYPQFSVIERPASAKRTGPDYLLLLGATLASALGCGVLSVWLYGFLGHDRATPAYVTLQDVHMYPQDAEDQLGYARQPDARLDPAATPRLHTGGSENIPDSSLDSDEKPEGKNDE